MHTVWLLSPQHQLLHPTVSLLLLAALLRGCSLSLVYCRPTGNSLFRHDDCDYYEILSSAVPKICFISGKTLFCFPLSVYHFRYMDI